MNDWQPIETAPKDGTWVLAWNSVHHRTGRAPVTIVRWRDHVGYPWEGSDGYTAYGDTSFQHWMPLPKAPTPNDQEGKEG